MKASLVLLKRQCLQFTNNALAKRLTEVKIDQILIFLENFKWPVRFNPYPNPN
jgi:hypothetical protein